MKSNQTFEESPNFQEGKDDEAVLAHQKHPGQLWEPQVREFIWGTMTVYIEELGTFLRSGRVKREQGLNSLCPPKPDSLLQP